MVNLSYRKRKGRDYDTSKSSFKRVHALCENQLLLTGLAWINKVFLSIYLVLRQVAFVLYYV